MINMVLDEHLLQWGKFNLLHSQIFMKKVQLTLYNSNSQGDRKKDRIMEIIELWEVELFSYI